MADLLQQQVQQASPVNPNPGTNQAIPGVLVNGSFWHWKDQVNEKANALRKARNGIQMAINVFVVLVALACLAAFVFSATTGPTVNIFTIEYWQTPKLSLFAFWFGLLSFQFLFYRWQYEKSKLVKLPKLKPDAVVEATTIASLDQIKERHNSANVFSEESRGAIEDAYTMAKKAGHAEVSAIHIFTGTFSTKSVGLLFMRLGVSFDQIRDAIRRKMSSLPAGQTVLGQGAHMIMAKALENALKHQRPSVSSIELFVEAYKSDEFIRELLYSVDVEEKEFENVVSWVRINEQLRERYEEFRKAASFKPRKNMNRAYTAVATPFLDRVSEDLTRAAAYGKLPLLVDRKREMTELLRSIEGGRQSVVLVGPPGVGKQSIVFGLAELMAAEQVPEILQDKRLVRLDIPVIVSSKGGSGAEERLLFALQEVGASGNLILVIEDIDQLASQSTGGVDLASVLAGELDKGYTFAIATTSPQGYSSFEGSVLAQKLQKIDVPEPERDDAIRVIESKMGGIENKNQVIFTYQSLASIVDLSNRYMHDEFLPEKALTLAEEIALDVGKTRQGKEWPRVTKAAVAKVVSSKTNVPVTEVTKEEGAKLLELEDKMHERIIGQEEAVIAVASALRRARAELRSEGRPIANFLFLGPTGVGKTELAKTTAETYFGNEDSMIRFDMSEYQDKASIMRLIGGPGEGGLMTEAVRKKPFALLLLDELEKAHPDILNLFLQVMDDGRLTDGSGRTVDFTNVILIATSNAATQYIQDSVAANVPMEEMRTHLMEEELKTVYRPEFLNRFDGVMVFKPLSEEDVVAIAYLMIEKVAKRLEAKGLSFRASDEAIHELAKKGYDPKFGARPLRRVVQETVDNAIAEIMLKGEVGRRDTLVLEPGGVVRVEKAEVL